MKDKGRILVVDDSSSVRSTMYAVLQTDFEVEEAGSGEEALAVLSRFDADLVLLDLLMPGINGYEVCKRIKSDSRLESVKVLIVSHMTTLDERLKGYEAGADDYIMKPFNAQELMAKVCVFMRLKTAEDGLRQLNEQLNEQVRLRTQQLMDAERMAAIGRYAAGIVHNLNTPLQVIMGNAELLSIRHPQDRRMMNLRKAAGQMKKIVGAILSTCRQESVAEYSLVDLNQVLKDQVEFLRAAPFFKHHIQVQWELGAIPRYRGLYHHFSQSLGNLIKNAADAMFGHKEAMITIKTAIEDTRIAIVISDTGPGIPESRIHRIFDPFFTTKPLTASDERPTGTGLGLASAREMIASYGGDIQVETQVGGGATFTVRLPLENGESRESSPLKDDLNTRGPCHE